MSDPRTKLDDAVTGTVERIDRRIEAMGDELSRIVKDRSAMVRDVAELRGDVSYIEARVLDLTIEAFEIRKSLDELAWRLDKKLGLILAKLSEDTKGEA